MKDMAEQFLKGYHYAVDAGADYVFQTDSDGQTLPEEFWQFWENEKNADFLSATAKKEKMVCPGFL